MCNCIATFLVALNFLYNIIVEKLEIVTGYLITSDYSKTTNGLAHVA